ncbi:hypothetical protein CC80DRAFT_165474 [Byssothecium circinans]|uniref:Aminoglycoside phosphotransferase domain-containing protein n=1 Tax=Byssothecium circinans TaxID=147558 RepID=A0A6A5TQK3_9PLEO|nr:hypothetical protein CC80DRAFT_165474 [Byssothecium circinans]
MDQSQDPFNGKYGQLLLIKEIGSKDYIETEHSFTKRQPLRVVLGGATGWKWGPQRLYNEAVVLDFISQNTTIPVPRLLQHGYDSSGRYYVTMERISGVELYSIGNQCRKPGGVQHVISGRCGVCQDIARKNADDFISRDVIPQLQSFRSYETGFEGFVLPPPRIVEMHERDSWLVKRSLAKEYCLVHGDLAAHNIMMCPDTLRVKYIFDWEQCGYYPPEMELELWNMQGMGYYKLFDNDELIDREIRLITP